MSKQETGRRQLPPEFGEKSPNTSGLIAYAMTDVANKTETVSKRAAVGDLDPMAARQLLSDSEDSVIILDLEGRVQGCNSAALSAFEHDCGGLCGYWPSSWPEANQSLVAHAISAAQQGHSSRFSAARTSKDCETRWWDVLISPNRDANARPMGLIAVARDISHLKSVERALRESQRNFTALANNMAQLAWLADRDGKVYWYNERWINYTGLSQQEMLAKGWEGVYHPEHVERVKRTLADCIKSGEPWEDIFPILGRDGTYRWFLSRAMPVHDPEGKIIIWSGTNTDVSDQREASLRLRQLARLIELSHEAIMVWTPDEGVMLWNNGCEELYGYTREEAVGKKVSALLKPTGSDHHELLGTGVWSGEVRRTAKDASVVWVESRSEVLNFGGRKLVLETHRDITERRAAEDARSQLIGELNHRVKNTLAIVQSIVSTMGRRETNVRNFVEQFRGRLQSIASAHDVLTDAHWAGAEMRDIVQSQLHAAAEAQTARVHFGGDSVRLPPQLAVHFALILHELICNSVNFGALNVPSGKVSITWSLEADAHLSVVWREIGGPPVIEPAAKGFGVTLIERAGRLPNLQSTLSFEPAGVVCKLRFQLPETAYGPCHFFDLALGRRRDAQPETGCTSSIKMAQPRKSILIIEDEPLIAMEVEEILRDAGFATLGPAASLQEAMDAVQKLRFDVALVDGNLMGETVGALIDALESRKIPYIVVTGFARDHFPNLPPRASLVAKPLSPRILLEAVNRELTRP